MDENFSLERSAVIRWKVDANFSSSEPESQVFDFNGSSWSFKLAKLRHVPDCIGICLLKKDWNSTLSKFSTFAFIEDRDKRAHFPCGWYVCRPGNYFWICKYTDLLAKDGITQFDDGITFCFVLSPETTSEDKTETEVKSAQSSISDKSVACTECLVTDLRRLLDDSSQYDVTLKCGKRTIPAHKLILSARSEVFAAMLRNDMSESRNGVIEISDMDPAILDLLLQFIYSSKLSDLSVDSAPQLYVAADKYAMESLRNLCSSFLKENLADNNACSTLHLADVYNDKDLKESVVSFILNSRLFRKEDIWFKFCEDHPKLASEVLNRAYKTLFP